MVFKKTKIIATLGPASRDSSMLEKIILAGADCIRLNFSHSNHEGHGKSIKLIREVSKKLGLHIAIIADIQGPKMRVGKMPLEGVVLTDDQKITLDTSAKEFDGKNIPIPSEAFAEGIKPGAVVFFDDGIISITVTKKKGALCEATVIKGGTLFSNKGINVPELALDNSIITQKDRADIAFAVKMGADYVALSFLRTGEDVKEARKLLKNSKIKIIAKIERPEALVNIDEIIDLADAVMVARGDLGIETPLWELPIRQKEIIERVRAKAKPVIVATQMLDSMIRNPLPTRAEVSDVANAVYDSADAVMLSGETASGKYPLEAVEMMCKILKSTELHGNTLPERVTNKSNAFFSVAESASHIAEELKAKAIFIETLSGQSAQTISYFRSPNSIIAITNNETTAAQLQLVWGVIPFLFLNKSVKDVNDIILPAIGVLKKENFLKKGDTIICVFDENLVFSGKAKINTIAVKSV